MKILIALLAATVLGFFLAIPIIPVASIIPIWSIKKNSKADSFDKLSEWSLRARQNDFTEEALAEGKKISNDLTPDEAVFVADRLIKIIERTREMMPKNFTLARNRPAVVETLDKLLTIAENHRYCYADVDISFAQFYLGKQYEILWYATNDLQILEKSEKWIKKSETQPRCLS